jgi:hypothetical protein
MTDQPFDERGEAHEAMGTVVSSYGARVLSNPQMLRNLVADLLPDAPRERSLLVSAAEAGIATEMTQYVEEQHIDAETAVQLVARALSERTMIDSTASMWVTTEFAQALGYPARTFTSQTIQDTPSPSAGIPSLPEPPTPPHGIPSLPDPPPLAGFPPPSPSSPQYAETMTAGQYQQEAAQSPAAQYPEGRPASQGDAGGTGQVPYQQWQGAGASAPDPGPQGWGGQGASVPDPGQPGWGGQGASAPSAGQPAWNNQGPSVPDPGPPGWGGQGGSVPDQGQPGWGGQAASAQTPGGWPASGAPAQNWSAQGGTAPVAGSPAWANQGQTAPIGGATGWPPPGGTPAGGGGPYRPAKPPGNKRGPLIAILAGVGVLILYFAIIAPVASIFPFGGKASPTASPSASVPASQSATPTPTPSPTADLAPGVASLTQLLPFDVDQPDTECQPIQPPYHWVNPGLVQALSCNDPGLSGGTVYAYQMDSTADFQAAFKNFNKWWGFDFTAAGTNCPPAAGKQGTVGWNDKYFPQRPNQSLECSMVGSGSAAAPAYAYAYPTEDAFILAQAAPGTTFKTLDAWWTNNAGPAVSPTPETP